MRLRAELFMAVLVVMGPVMATSITLPFSDTMEECEAKERAHREKHGGAKSPCERFTRAKAERMVELFGNKPLDWRRTSSTPVLFNCPPRRRCERTPHWEKY